MVSWHRRFDTRESDYRKVDQAWSCWRVTPMATNIQLVFFRRPDGGDVLVKFLFNERESRIRLESDLAPYYRWNDVKRYFDERIAHADPPLTVPDTSKEGGSNIAATLFRLYGRSNPRSRRKGRDQKIPPSGRIRNSTSRSLCGSSSSKRYHSSAGVSK